MVSYILIALAVLAIFGVAGYLNRKQIGKFVGSMGAIDGFTTEMATGPTGATGAASTGTTPGSPNIPDPAVPFTTGVNAGAGASTNAPVTGSSGFTSGPGGEGFANPSEPSNVPFAAGNAPSNCYPKNQLKATELLPADPNSKWAQVNPQGAGDIAGKNYLNAGALIGVNTVGQSLRNASHDLRSEPANPQNAVSPWFNSTIEPDINRRMLEIQ